MHGGSWVVRLLCMRVGAHFLMGGMAAGRRMPVAQELRAKDF